MFHRDFHRETRYNKMSEYDKPRCVRIITDWIGYTEEVVDAQADDHDTYPTMEEMLTATAETHADIKAMKGLREELEHDCE